MLPVLLAVLSPIGGQASLQMLATRDKSEITHVPITYLTTGEKSYSQFGSGSGFWEALPPINAIYAGSLTASTLVKNSEMDLWGNVKIPYLSRLTSSADEFGWQDVPLDLTLGKYSSLIGIPASGLSESTNTSYTLETNYFDLDCYNVFNGTLISLTAGVINLNVSNNGTDYGDTRSTYNFGIDGTLALGYGMTWNYINDTGRNFPQRTILFQSFGFRLKYANSLAYCHISTAYVEAFVNCTGLACGVTKMRPSQLPHPDPRLVPFEFAWYQSVFSWQFMLATNLADKEGSHHGSSLTEYYINDPVLPLSNTYRIYVELYKLAHKDMSVRLGQVINSYYLASLDPWGITGLSSGAGNRDAVNSDGTKVSSNLAANVTTISTTSVNRVVYVCEWGWWVVFVLACLVMLVVACTGALLSWQTVGPDILGYVSTMTRDSKYLSLPNGGSALDGAYCARLLKKLKIQMHDVQPEKDTGYWAFALLGGKPRPPVVDRIYK